VKRDIFTRHEAGVKPAFRIPEANPSFSRPAAPESPISLVRGRQYAQEIPILQHPINRNFNLV
jgi:hypothetical protein